jgi:hypothetical protein
VPEAKTGVPTGLTLAGRGRSMDIQADVHASISMTFLPHFGVSHD